MRTTCLSLVAILTQRSNAVAFKPETSRAEWLHKLYTPLSYPHVYLAVAQQRGVSAEHILTHAGLSLDLLDQSTHNRISPLEYALLIHSVLDLTGNHGLGFEIGKKLTLTAHGHLGYAILCAANLAQVMQLIMRFKAIRSRGMNFVLSSSGDTVILGFHPEIQIPAALRQVIDEALLSSCYRSLQFLLNQTDIGAELWFEHAEPEYFASFAAQLPQVHFSMPATQLRIPHGLFAAPLPMHNPDSLQIAIAQCQREYELYVSDDDDSLLKVRSHLQMTRDGYPTPEQLAEQLHMSPRTLRRKLQSQGSNYKKLLEDARRRDAITLIDSHDIEIAKVALMLGYTNPANFSRAFKQWTGSTPSQYRTLLKQA